MLKRRFLTSSILWLTILDFSKGVNPWFWVQISKSLIHRFSSKSSRENFSVILKSAINDEKARFFWGGGGGWVAILDSSKRVNSWFRGKIEKSLFYCLFVEIKSKKMFHKDKDCRNCRKDVFLTSWILEVAILHFSKGVNPWFWVKIWKSLIDQFCSKSSRENFLAILKSAKNAEGTF